MRPVFLVCVCVLFLLSVTPVWCAEPSHPPYEKTRFQQRAFLPPGQPDPRVTGSALFQCQEDLGRLCVTPEEREKGSFDPSQVWPCMLKNVEAIENADCKTYITAAATCQEDVKRIPDCLSPAANEMVSLRRCLRKVTPEQVSEACSSSEFFRTTQHPKW